MKFLFFPDKILKKNFFLSEKICLLTLSTTNLSFASDNKILYSNV